MRPLPYPLAHHAMGLVLLVTVVAFWPQYFAVLGDAPIAFHVHGLSATLWILLVAFQSWAIHHRRVHLHRTVGRSSLVLFPILIASLVMIANVSAEAYASGDVYRGVVGPFFVWGTFVPLVAFPWLFAQALRHRRDAALHSGYMLATIFFLWEPAASRLLVRFVPTFAIQGTADFQNVAHVIALGSAMVIPVALYLYLRREEGRAPLLATILLLLFQVGGIYAVAGTNFWRAGVGFYAQMPEGLTVTAALAVGALAATGGWLNPAAPPQEYGTPVRAEPGTTSERTHATLHVDGSTESRVE